LRKRITPSDTKLLIYILPLEWHVPELAMEKENLNNQGHGADPTSHGNPSDFDPNLYKLLYSRPDVNPTTPTRDIISKASRQKPVLIIKVDLKKQKVIGLDTPPKQGKYADIPVPIL
jgi:hypothetical protein